MTRVISAFDGLSGAYHALLRAGIFKPAKSQDEMNKYYAFENDKYAIQISEKNFPDVRHLGDIKNWKFFDQLPPIDLIIAGFPCQSHSIAGNRMGLSDLRGSLLYDLLAMIEFYRPKNILLENVKGFLSSNKGAAHRLVMDTLESYGYDMSFTVINSALVSAQNRERVYYTNWKVEQPEDRGIVLADILEDSGTGVIKSHGKIVERNEKAMCLDASYFKGVDNHGQRTMIRVGTADVNGHDILKRVYSIHGKSPTLNTNGGGNREPKIDVDGFHWRKLTPLECEKLQGLPDNTTFGVSNTQRYKMIGNGFQIDTVAHVLSQLI